MGFKHWFQGLIVIGLFMIVIPFACFMVSFWGSRMINDLGNHPSKSDEIQAAAGWKIFLIEIVSFTLLVGVFIFLYNLEFS